MPIDGGECRLRNPWANTPVTIRRGDRTQTASDPLICFPTTRGETICVHVSACDPWPTMFG